MFLCLWISSICVNVSRSDQILASWLECYEQFGFVSRSDWEQIAELFVRWEWDKDGSEKEEAEAECNSLSESAQRNFIFFSCVSSGSAPCWNQSKTSQYRGVSYSNSTESKKANTGCSIYVLTHSHNIFYLLNLLGLLDFLGQLETTSAVVTTLNCWVTLPSLLSAELSQHPDRHKNQSHLRLNISQDSWWLLW